MREYYLHDTHTCKNLQSVIEIRGGHAPFMTFHLKIFHWNQKYLNRIYVYSCMYIYLHKRHNIIFTILIFPGTQVLYLVDESEETGKGTNSVISMLHHHFQYKSYGETAVELHMDNCTGQNKNNFVIWYE